MDKRGGISKDKLASGLLRGAVVSGLVSGLAAASLGGVPTADATCIGISASFPLLVAALRQPPVTSRWCWAPARSDRHWVL